MRKVKHLQQQDTHITEIATKCKSRKWNKTLYFLEEHGIIFWKIKDRSNIFHAIMVPQIMQTHFLYLSHTALGHNGPTRLYNHIKRHYYWRKLHVRSCPECQQVTVKECHYVDFHLHIPQFPMSFISMDILGQFHETTK